MADHLVIGGQLGNYLIESVVGRGGMSVVYRAKHARLGTSVALKVLAPELSSDDSFRERFLREAQMAAGIDHPNVIPIHDMGLHDDSLYIVMRYVAGGDLKTLLATTGPLQPEQAISLLRPVGLALDAAHAHALVHRDVKPGNILIQRSTAGEIEHVYLTDFGIAKSFAASGGLTRAGGLLGTVEYMAPEQTHGEKVSAATDVYALASVFYQCITGRTPFEQELLEGNWPLPATAAPTPASSRLPGLSPALDEILATGLSPDPANRYATCVEFLDACRDALAASPARAGETAAAAVADSAVAGATAALDDELSAVGAASEREPVRAGTGASRPPAPPSPAAGRAAKATAPAPAGAGRNSSKYRVYIGGLIAALVTAAITFLVIALSSSKKETGTPSQATLARVPTNHVTGTGTAVVRLKGNVAKVTLTTNGLDYNEELSHALHIHAGGKGLCPPSSVARLHNGHLSISTTDGIKFYGPPVLALTTKGDTSPSSILVFARYPTGGTIHYKRTITLPALVARRVRENNGVIVVHGTDYDRSGIYSGVLERSELNSKVPATATAPALCGPLSLRKTTASAAPRSPSHAVYAATLSVNLALLFACEADEAATSSTRSPRRATATRA